MIRMTIATAAALIMYLGSAIAQTDWSQVEVTAEHVAGNVYVLYGRGGNIGLYVASNGVYLIDDQYAPLTDRIIAAIQTVSDGEIRFLINTHVHGDHTGGNENFGRAGVTIVAHELVRSRLAEGLISRYTGKRKAAAPRESLPVLTFNDLVTFHLDDEEMRVMAVPPAHTDGDSFIQFRHADVLHLGDVFRTTNYPYIDRHHGGSFQGSIDALGQALELAGPNTKIIPGHGVVSDREGVRKYRDMMVIIRDRVQTLIDAGNSVQEIIAAKPTAEFDERWLGTGWNNLEVILTGLYEELKQPSLDLK
jgi:cyclase